MPELDYVPSCALPTPWAEFRLHGFIDQATQKEHIALTLGDLATPEPLLTRVHSECLTGDALFSQRCDCGAQLETSLRRIAAAGRGLVLYLRQEGRGIGLSNKLRAYRLQDEGADTVDANHALGFEPDLRDYRIVRPMLVQLGITAPLRLMTNNPHKLAAIRDDGTVIAERVALVVNRNPTNARYLATKAARLSHTFDDPADPV
ncbi:MAG TPA: GTP cyclohydrolase II [Steroidobacteraceae bacterium]